MKYHCLTKENVIKKICLITVVVIAVGILFLSNETADAATFGNYEYTVENGEAVITGYTGSSSTVDIPSVIDGNTVIGIGRMAFDSCKSLVTIRIPESVTSIGDMAFYGCENLSEIIIPDSVTEMGIHVFTNCKKMKSITLSKNLKSIKEYAFASCISLESIVIPDGVTTIEDRVFSGCVKLISITIPASVTTISDNAVTDVNLSNITIYCVEDTEAETYAIKKGLRVELIIPDVDDPPMDPINSPTASPVPASTQTQASDNKVEATTNPIVNPISDKDVSKAYPVEEKKDNTVVITVGIKTVKSTKLKKAKKTIKALSIKNAQGDVKITLLKKGTATALYKKIIVNNKGVITISKGKYKKGTYKAKFSVAITGNTEYKQTRKTVTLKIKIK